MYNDTVRNASRYNTTIINPVTGGECIDILYQDRVGQCIKAQVNYSKEIFITDLVIKAIGMVFGVRGVSTFFDKNLILPGYAAVIPIISSYFVYLFSSVESETEEVTVEESVVSSYNELFVNQTQIINPCSQEAKELVSEFYKLNEGCAGKLSSLDLVLENGECYN